MNKVLHWSITVALAGFLFGFDAIVISGTDIALQALWQSSDFYHGVVVMSTALWGTVLGALFGNVPSNRLGRKKTLLFIGLAFLVSAIGSALANNSITFAVFRFIGGLAIGASTIAAPAYITEITPSEKRGRLVALYQLSIVSGIIIAYISNYTLHDLGAHAWRWMLGVEAIPAILFTIMVMRIPYSPKWLALQGRLQEARNVAQQLGLQDEVLTTIRHESIRAPFWTSQNRKPIFLAIFIAFFNQLSGINGILYYSPRIFEAAGLSDQSAFLNSVGIGITNLIFTLIGMYLIDRAGRKKLLYIGSIGYVVALSLVGCSFLFGWTGMAVPVFIFLFIAAHAIGQGTVIWVFIAEIFPTNLRATGQTVGSTIHWILAASISSAMPYLFKQFNPAYVFWGFAAIMVLQFAWIYVAVPETKGVSTD